MQEWDVQSLGVDELVKVYQTVKVEDLTFEQGMQLLERVVTKLEGGSLTMMQSLTLQEFGSRLSAHCNKLMEQSEARVEQLKEDASRLAMLAEEEA